MLLGHLLSFPFRGEHNSGGSQFSGRATGGLGSHFCHTPNMEYTFINDACILGLTFKDLLSFDFINMEVGLPSH